MKISLKNEIPKILDNQIKILIKDIGSKFKNILKEKQTTIENMEKERSENIENKERLLQIGIVGRVKAGKSSLLNALVFDGESILPKAATPMTAALTILSYGKKLSAEVDFFSKKDIRSIKENYIKYNTKLEQVKEEKFENLKKKRLKKKTNRDIKFLNSLTKDETQEILEKSKKGAIRELKEDLKLSSTHDQYTKMIESGVNMDTLEENKILKSDNIENLSNLLLEYVGSDGKYMPFTKSVHIKLPQDNLKDIQIVDTPGLNDPVASREERTRELLKYCDVIFIVSPSGQFLSSEDTNLMDRITTKEGVRELFIVSSQVDNQLFGSEKERFNGILPDVLNGITSNLGNHLSSTLSQLKKDSPEIGNVYDQLIKQGEERVIYSSGICQTIKLFFDKRDKWDDGVSKVWENLTREYPDYFSDNDKPLSVANLDLLANMFEINGIIKNVRDKKDDILNKRKDEFINAKYNSLIKFKEALISYTKEQEIRINNTDIDDIKEQKKSLENLQYKGSSIIDDEYYDYVNKLKRNMSKELSKKLNYFLNEVEDTINNSEGSKSETWSTRGGFLWLSKEYHSRTYTTVRTGAIESSLRKLKRDAESTIKIDSDELISNWREDLPKKLTVELRNLVKDDDLDTHLLRKVIRNTINSVEYPNIKYNDSFPNNLKGQGTLTENSAEEYLSEAKNYLYTLNNAIRDDIDGYISKLISSLNKLKLSEQVFGNYKNDIEKLENEIKNGVITIERYKRLSNELNGVN